jgi:DNA-binding response OmpR family regulator
MRILVVDDDRHLAHAVQRGLRAEGYAVDVAYDGTEGLWFAQENPYDALVLDVMLPGLSGTDICARLREQHDWTPILMLTARDGAREEAAALDSGADDYLAKPFSYLVLLARLRALGRRGHQSRPAVLRAGDLWLDDAGHRCGRGDDLIELTPRQFALLGFLIARAGDVQSKQTILDHVWDFAFEGDPNIVEVYVRRLRCAIDEPFGRHSIETVRGAGYRIVNDQVPA